jgi:hypothetical protein
MFCKYVIFAKSNLKLKDMDTIKKGGKTTTDRSPFKNRQESRETVMKNALSSKEAATVFLKNAGILDKKGNLSKHYK